MTVPRIQSLLLAIVALSTTAPVCAEVYGGIEIGAKGIRAIAVDIAPKTAPRIVMIENQNTTLVADLASKKEFSPKALQETVTIVGHMAQKIRDEFKVPDKRLYIVGSSGLFAPLQGNADLIGTNKKRLAQAMQKQTGLTMDFVSVTREAELTILSVVPAKDRLDAVLMDIGSGNTKGGGATPKGLLTIGIPFGTVSFADRVTKDGGIGAFVETAERLRVEVLLPQLRTVLAGKAELAQRKRVYLAGGTVWALATFVKPTDRGTLVALTPPDIAVFAKLLRAHPDKLPDPDLSDANAEVRKQADKDLARVRKTFTRDQLVAGVEILQALAAAFQFDAADKQIYFARDAYIGWILGYTIEKGSDAK